MSFARKRMELDGDRHVKQSKADSERQTLWGFFLHVKSRFNKMQIKKLEGDTIWEGERI